MVDHIKLFSDIIQIQTVNDHEAELANYLSSYFDGTPAEVTKVTFAPGRDSLVVKLGELQNPDKVLVFSGHGDTVDFGDLSKWTYAPLSAHIEGDTIFGRGANDMKGGLAALFSAALELVAEDFDFGQNQLKLFMTVGEESGEYGAHQLVEAGFLDDVTALILGEPRTNFEIGYTNKGVIDYKVTVTGKSAHSSRPDLGDNALEKALVIIQDIQTYFAKYETVENPILGKLTNVISVIKSGTQVNQVPDLAYFMGNTRTIPETPNQQIFADLQALVDQYENATLEIIYPAEPLPVQPISEFTKLAQAKIQAISGQPGDLIAGSGANEGSEFIQANAKFPILIFGPSAFDNSHAVNESNSLEIYEQAVDIYKQIAIEYLA